MKTIYNSLIKEEVSVGDRLKQCGWREYYTVSNVTYCPTKIELFDRYRDCPLCKCHLQITFEGFSSIYCYEGAIKWQKEEGK